MIVKSENIDFFIDLINLAEIKNISVSSYHGYLLNDLDFLLKCPKIEKVYITGDNFDVSSIQHLKQLTFSSTSSSIEGIDFSNFPELDYCCIKWHPKMLHLTSCRRISQLKIRNYKPLSNDLSDIGDFPALRTLEFVDASISSLTGIAESISTLKAFYLKKLTDVSAIEHLSNLHEVVFGNCKKIVNFDKLGLCKSVKKMILSDCGVIPSIRFIRNMKKLVFFTFIGTIVEDGYVTPCIGLEYFVFDNKKWYSNTEKEIREMSK